MELKLTQSVPIEVLHGNRDRAQSVYCARSACHYIPARSGMLQTG
jgi:hypothetical protein